MDWQPSEEMIAWGIEHLGGLPLESIWAPHDSGLQYRKLSKTRFALIFMLDNVVAQVSHERLKLIIEACGYSVEKAKDIQILKSDSDTE
ncbi:hypothetical protein [Poseidonia sp.]|uniref:hypothetical protein n=1 Tax=Poseidonia sp. TaxID=2666344 RepID=UPI003F69F0B5